MAITSLYSNSSDAKVYVGTTYGYLNESFSESGYKSISAQTASIKVGYGIRTAYAVELSFDYTPNDENVFSTNDSDKYGIDLELMKAFDWDIFVYPFFKAGFGAGYFDIKNQNNNSINYSSYNLALGCFIPINEHFDAEIGYRYKFTSYEKVSETIKSVSSNINIGYLGINFRF